MLSNVAAYKNVNPIAKTSPFSSSTGCILKSISFYVSVLKYVLLLINYLLLFNEDIFIILEGED